MTKIYIIRDPEGNIWRSGVKCAWVNVVAAKNAWTTARLTYERRKGGWDTYAVPEGWTIEEIS